MYILFNTSSLIFSSSGCLIYALIFQITSRTYFRYIKWYCKLLLHSQQNCEQGVGKLEGGEERVHMDAHHTAGNGGVPLQWPLHKEDEFLLETAILRNPIATECGIVKFSKPELIVRTIVATGKCLQGHGQCIEEEVHPGHGFRDKEEQTRQGDAHIEGCHSELNEHGQRHEGFNGAKKSV